MIPGRWLHRFASFWCGTATREQIVEPLLSDFQHQWIEARGRRVMTLLRGYLAFWQTLALCTLRGGWHWLLTAPSRITFERIFVWAYAVGIVLVIVFGFAWVRTGTLDSTAGLVAIRKLIATFGPGLFLSHYWPRARRLQTRTLVLFGFASGIALGYWIDSDGHLGPVLYNLLYLPLVWNPLAWAVTRFHYRRPRSVK